MTPAEVCDLVFGEYTRDGPTPRPSCVMETSIPYQWSRFFDEPKPDWYLDPVNPPPYLYEGWNWGHFS